MPPGLITVTSTVPEPGGLTASITVAEITLNAAGFPAPKSTEVALLKPLPVMVTLVPPAWGPADGDTPKTTGSGTYEQICPLSAGITTDVVARTPSRVRQGAGIATVTGFVVGLTITSASA